MEIKTAKNFPQRIKDWFLERGITLDVVRVLQYFMG